MTLFEFRRHDFGIVQLGVRAEPGGGMTPVVGSRLR
jgi:hypothetical protein